MGNAAIWYTPETDSGVLRKVSFPGRLTDLQYHAVRDIDIAETYAGTRDEQTYRTRPRVEVEYGPFRDYPLRNDLLALENHLDRGGTCIVTEDDERAWAAFVELPADSQAQIITTTKPWSAIHNGAPTGQMVMHGPSPEHLEERFALTSYSPLSNTAIVSPATRHDWRDRRWGLLRCEGFLPLMRRAKEDYNRSCIEHDGRQGFTFRLFLDMDVVALDDLSGIEGLVLQGTTDTGGGKHTGVNGSFGQQDSPFLPTNPDWLL